MDNAADGLTTVADVACTVCGCVCDDLTVSVRSGKIASVAGTCSLSEPWFAALGQHHPPVARIAGREVELEAAVAHAAFLLNESRSPLIFGLSRSSTEGQRAAVELAEQLGANIDTTASICHGPSIMAIQQVGESTCSLGEIRNRADLVIFWGANPAVSHPRHFERYSVDAKGLLTSRGRKDRTVVVVDIEPTATSELADRFILVRPGRDFEAIYALRTLLRGGGLPEGVESGAARDELVWLIDQMKTCRYGAVFFGLGLAQTGLGHLNVDALLRLTAELNDITRFTARRLRIPGDVTGADAVLCWQTGYPFAVNLARGYPRYNPGEFSANELLARREVDCCLLLGSECVSGLSPEALSALGAIPVIALDSPHLPSPLSTAVQFTTAVYGVHVEGTAYRMDEIPIRLRSFLECGYPTDAEVLRSVRDVSSNTASLGDS